MRQHHFVEPMMAQVRDTHPEKTRIENTVRVAAIAVAKGFPLTEATLTDIVAKTSDPGLSIADRIARATSMAAWAEAWFWCRYSSGRSAAKSPAALAWACPHQHHAIYSAVCGPEKRMFAARFWGAYR